jgi:hypothetical protein
MKINIKSTSKLFLVLAGTALLFFVGAIKIIDIAGSPVVQDKIAMATSVQPETLTELYFEDHNSLPRYIETGKKYHFTFTVHNLEHKNMSYPYVVYMNTIDRKIIFERGIISLPDDGYETIRTNFTPLMKVDTKIVVELTDKDQVIDFLMKAQQ